MPRQSLRDRATRHWVRILETREPLREIQRGIMGNGAGTVRVPGRPDRVYVRVTAVGNALWEVLNDKVQDVLGLPVLIRKTLTGRDWEVIDVDKTMITNTGPGWSGQAYVPDHQHTNLNITVRNLTPLKSYAKNQTSLTVRVTPLYYTYGGELKFFPGGDLDLSVYQPAVASQGVQILTYLDPTTNLLGATVGQSAFFSPVLSLPKPPTPEFGYPSALVRTYYGQSYFRESDFIDYRLILDKVMPVRGHTIYDEGVRVTPDRSILDFQGALITTYDDPTGEKTIVALSGAITGHDILGQGQAVTDRTILDFQGPLVATYDDPTDLKTIVSTYLPPQLGHEIMDQGALVTDRTILDFQGPLVSTYDDPTNLKTIVSSYLPIISQLDAPDGAPAPAFSVDNDGKATGVNELYLLGQGAGVVQRLSDHRLTSQSITDHFRSGTIPTGFGWSTGAPFSSTPSTVNYNAFGDYMRVADTVANRFFLRDPISVYADLSFYLRATILGAAGKIGIRIDDGTDNNYAQVYLIGATNGAANIETSVRSGGWSPTVTTGPTVLQADFHTMELFFQDLGGGSYRAILRKVSETGSRANIVVGGSDTWTPTRVGIMYDGTASVDVDWFISEFS